MQQSSKLEQLAAVAELAARSLPGVRCFHFDAVGVPTAYVMQMEYGGGEQWQMATTRAWLHRLRDLPEDVEVAVLDGQTRPSFVLDARSADGASAHVVLLDCAPEVRAARLREGRGQPELVTVQMDAWAAYLRGQADALRLEVIDTTHMSVTAVPNRLELSLRRMAEWVPPA